MKFDTPPSSVHGDDIDGEDDDDDDEDLGEEVPDDEELIYVGDIDQVIGDIEEELPDEQYYNDNDNEETRQIRDDAVYTFKRHSGSVFCGGLHPTRRLAVTGSEDDKAYVWNIDTGEVVFECTDHEDSIIMADFSSDGQYLATCDMGGAIRVRKCGTDGGDSWDSVWEYQTGDLNWGMWHPGTRVLFCASDEVYYFKIPSGDTKVLQGHGAKSECGVVFPDGKRLAVAYEDGSFKIWDLKLASVVHHITDDYVHTSTITALDCYHDNNIMITGSLSGKALLTKSVDGKSIGVLDVNTEIETIAFSKDSTLGLVAIGSLDGTISIWDVARQNIRFKCSTKDDENASGVTKFIWIKHYLVCACLDGSIKIFDGKTGMLLHHLTGHRSEILDISYSSTNNVFLTTSDEGTAKIFKCDIQNS